jgi:hypothetical protein
MKTIADVGKELKHQNAVVRDELSASKLLQMEAERKHSNSLMHKDSPRIDVSPEHARKESGSSKYLSN